MNEYFGIEPIACANSTELRLLLRQFGPYTGRYIAGFPANWEAQIRQLINGWSTIEQARAQRELQHLNQKKTLLRIQGTEFDKSQAWLANAKRALAKKTLDSIIVSRENGGAYPCIDDVDLPPTTDESVIGSAAELARVSSALIMISPELLLVDPYLDPSLADRASIVTALFHNASKACVQKITIWASATGVQNSKEKLQSALLHIARAVSLRNTRIEMNLVSRGLSVDKLHARYLLSIRGAIRFDRGFQDLHRDKVDISVVGAKVHEDLIKTYMEPNKNFTIVESIRINAA